MSEQNDKTPDQVSDEDYKVAPTSADEARVKKYNAATHSKEEQANGENYRLPIDTKVEEEIKEEVE